MTENRVVALRQKGAIDDPLTEILRTGARRLIAQAVEAEFETFLASTAELVLPDGRRRVAHLSTRKAAAEIERRGLGKLSHKAVARVRSRLGISSWIYAFCAAGRLEQRASRDHSSDRLPKPVCSWRDPARF